MFFANDETVEYIYWTMLQFPTEELVKEVENSIAEFKRHKQDYDEERVKEQVSILLPIKEGRLLLLFLLLFFFVQ